MESEIEELRAEIQELREALAELKREYEQHEHLVAGDGWTGTPE